MIRRPRWRSDVYWYMSGAGILSRHGIKWAGVIRKFEDDLEPVAYRYISRREALRYGLELVRAALRPDPAWVTDEYARIHFTKEENR